MADTFRALCSELLRGLDENRHPEVRYPGHLRQIMASARAALAEADEPAVPEGREPAAVISEPSDAELLCIAAEAIDGYGNGINPGDYEPATECAVEAYGSELCAYARAVLARWGNLKASLTSSPPVDGEVAECAAELLQRQVLVPVSVSERLPGPEDCDAEGRCWWLALHQSWPCLYLMKADIALAAAVATHWLPAHALPLPEMKADIALAEAVATRWLHAHALPRPEVSE